MEKWTNPVVRIVKSQLQVAYPAYINDFKSQFIFFNGSIPKMHNHLKILKKVWRNSCMSSFRHLLTFNIVTGCDNWLLDCDANTEYVYSRSVTQERDRETERERAENLIETHQVVQKIWRSSSSILTIFVNFLDFVAFTYCKKTNDVSI